jgi:integrase
MPTHLEKRRRLWYAVLDVPVAQRPLIGKRRFFQSLGTDSFSVAQTRVLPVIHGWKMLIEEAKSGKTGSAQWRNFLDKGRKSGVPEWEIQEAAFSLAVEMDEDGDKTAFVSYLVATGQAVLLSEHLKPFLDDLRTRQSGQTIENKARHVRAFLSVFKFADDVTEDSLGDFVGTHLADLAAGTQTNHLSSFKMFWRYLGKKKLVPRSLEMFREIVAGITPPETKEDKYGNNGPALQSKRQHFEPKDYHKLLAGVQMKRKRGKSLHNLIQLGAYTGCRIEEICSLRVEDVNLQEAFFTVRNAKTQAGNRKVPIHADIFELLENLAAASTDGFIMSGLTENRHKDRSDSLGGLFGRLKTSLGYGREHVFHSFRKGVATQLENAEVPEFIAARILGHKIKTNSYGLYSGGASLETLRGAISVLKW